MNGPNERMEAEIERLTALLVPYLCERTGLTAHQVQTVLDANNDFWENQPSMAAHMVLFQMPEDDELNG